MPKKKKPTDFSSFAQSVGKEFMRLAGIYADAVKQGAEAAGQSLADAAREKPAEPPAEMAVGKLLAAVKLGVRHAGERLADTAAEYVGRTEDRERQRPDDSP